MRNIFQFLLGGAVPRDREILFFEVGAHVGKQTQIFLKMFPLARLWIFEPDPRNTAELNRLGLDKKTRLFELAVGDRDGEMTMHLSSGRVMPGDPRTTLTNWTFSSSLKKPKRHLKEFPWVKFLHEARVKVARLDTLKREQGFGDIEFMWADVQGAEDMLIAGAQETLARTRYFYTEYANVELYEGQIGLEEIVKRLPGGARQWQTLAVFDDDVLLKNTAM
jgi:FkbM family methyltransferase